MQRLLILFAIIGLSACAGLNEQANDAKGSDQNSSDYWQAKGKFSYRSEQTTESGNFDWRQNGEDYQLRLFGPLGIGTVKISGNPNLVRIQNRDQDISSDQPLSLMYRLTGLEIPLNSLPKWIKASPAGLSPKNINQDSEQRITSFEERGWTLEYNDYGKLDTADIPATIDASREDVGLKLIVRSFEYQ